MVGFDIKQAKSTVIKINAHIWLHNTVAAVILTCYLTGALIIINNLYLHKNTYDLCCCSYE